jgi:hypothetical protein
MDNLNPNDQFAIRDLPAHYADIITRRRPELLGEVFADDAVWLLPGIDPIVGIDAVISTIAQVLTRYEYLMQLASEMTIRADSEGIVGRTMITEWGRTSDGFNVHMAGPYTDRFVRTDAGWRFKERRFDFFYRGRSEAVGKFYELPELEHWRD